MGAEAVFFQGGASRKGFTAFENEAAKGFDAIVTPLVNQEIHLLHESLATPGMWDEEGGVGDEEEDDKTDEYK